MPLDVLDERDQNFCSGTGRRTAALAGTLKGESRI
jgi:hypothetical protein